jgi:hypothetical protein
MYQCFLVFPALFIHSQPPFLPARVRIITEPAGLVRRHRIESFHSDCDHTRWTEQNFIRLFILFIGDSIISRYSNLEGALNKQQYVSGEGSPVAYLFPGGALINEMTVHGAGFATKGDLYPLSRTMRG